MLQVERSNQSTNTSQLRQPPGLCNWSTPMHDFSYAKVEKMMSPTWNMSRKNQPDTTMSGLTSFPFVLPCMARVFALSFTRYWPSVMSDSILTSMSVLRLQLRRKCLKEGFMQLHHYTVMLLHYYTITLLNRHTVKSLDCSVANVTSSHCFVITQLHYYTIML